MPRQAKIYANAIVFAGLATLAAAALQWTSPRLDHFLICLLLALLGATFKVTLPGSSSCISPSVVPILLALGTLSWQETAVIAGCAGFVQCLWRPEKRPALVQILFNGANLVLASVAAYAVSHAIAGQASLGLFLVAATVFQVLNTLMVAVVLCLVDGTPVRGIWRNIQFWSYPYHLASAAFAAVWAQSENVAAIGSLSVLCSVMLYLMSSFFGELVKRLAPAKAVR